MLAIGRHVSKLSGYAPALPTPFTPDGRIDCDAFERFCARQIAEGATALVVCGTTGEAPTLTPAEHRKLVWLAVKVARGRVPVIAGAGSNATQHAIALGKDAEAAGADAILSVVPYYNKPMQAGLLAHFRAVADALIRRPHPIELTRPQQPGQRARVETIGLRARLADAGVARRDDNHARRVRFEDPRDLPRIARHLQRDPVPRIQTLPEQLKRLGPGLDPACRPQPAHRRRRRRFLPPASTTA